MKVLRGIVRKIEKTGESTVDEEGTTWEKCIFHIELTSFSKRTKEEMPENLKGKIVKVIRWCAFDWHYRTNVPATLTPEETERVLKGSFDLAV
ncbi:MAG: hypothetical protein DRJ59_06005 [Thermoprotei archaeon]|nr:MAG: hypothetical protein DRJ59_06005 [Thermoprotei archaeon]